MTRGLWQRRLRQLHLALAIAVGAQVLLWFASGLFMVGFDIDRVRGDHLRTDRSAPFLPESGIVAPEIAMAAAPFPANEALLTMRSGEPVWVVRYGLEEVLVSGLTGERLPVLNEEAMARLAESSYAGRGTLAGLTYLEERPRAVGGDGPVWEASFGPDDRAALYFHPLTGELEKVRTPLWYSFDFMWGLHIMDWSSRENFNSWWLRATTVFALLFALSGSALVATRVARWMGR
ncbi:hypothetical protein [Parvularcula maris]|uniref:PepSY domain-containing protein n=1 Tax=Parvularcula maris TaxID=2965077 RepID=A0A9X2L9A8_9PROT|nr:hypothetical protein [Parvularcula maris]MCQ8185336.1 hypothetical protein [Parvularcula maris]